MDEWTRCDRWEDNPAIVVEVAAGRPGRRAVADCLKALQQELQRGKSGSLRSSVSFGPSGEQLRQELGLAKRRMDEI